MFKYNMSASIMTILARSELRNALMDEWPSLVSTNINTIATETELVDAVASSTGRTQVEAREAVRNWMERQGLPPIDARADALRTWATDTWEDEGGSGRSQGHN
ncbi:hypothetical protein [Pelagibacterium lentulum]|uniref:Uncharacterized protein n=1 Tax=Pelagibacterium lentulum TaxID=2029865 RepID=A0A916RMX3_9HYPH|nr:hypothetical protein [Pelagibacterium lentulum]GGA62456.1 hypothetical protein GCM10011499_36030 [Pelagibacterium lentulum]